MYLFGYGSLMNPQSLRRTLPGVDTGGCLPAICRGYVRSFGVAFPNDGSEADKTYVGLGGRRPGVVLFCDLRPAPDHRVNGVCVPIDETALDALRRRELRYDLIELTGPTVRYSAAPSGSIGPTGPSGPVLAFVGKSRFTRPGDVARGVVSAEYVRTVAAGAVHWDRRYPGFADDYREMTVPPDPSRVVPLTRVDRVWS